MPASGLQPSRAVLAAPRKPCASRVLVCSRGARLLKPWVVSPWLLHRAGHRVPDAAGHGLVVALTTLDHADRALASAATPAAVSEAYALGRRGLAELAAFEQTTLLQPACDRLDPRWREPLRHVFGFRLGLAPSAPVLAWDDTFGAPWVANERIGWMNARVLPAWHRAVERDPSRLRADVDRVRRWGGVTASEVEDAVSGLI